MVTFSLCMIVKNEETVLDRCLQPIADIMDEIIIVDTGSTDHTKEIAGKYTDKVFCFPWDMDFAAARNFAFSKATMDYIYAPDADEVVDELNCDRLRRLKECLLPEIEIVQMAYITKMENNTVQNYCNEMRPKLFKRLRSFVWIDPVHETVRLDPVVFDSDVEILHLPQSIHAKRDFKVFERALQKNGTLSKRIGAMYAKELYKCGTIEDYANASSYFMSEWKEKGLFEEASCILARFFRMENRMEDFLRVCLSNIAKQPCSEVCCELGDYYLQKGEYEEAAEWFYNAGYSTQAVIDAAAHGRKAYEGLAECYFQLNENEQAMEYRKLAMNWQLPEDV